MTFFSGYFILFESYPIDSLLEKILQDLIFACSCFVFCSNIIGFNGIYIGSV